MTKTKSPKKLKNTEEQGAATETIETVQIDQKTIAENSFAAAITNNRFKVTSTGLKDIDENITFEECEGALRFLVNYRESSKWAIGDLLNFSEHAHGEKYSQLLNENDMDYSTMRKMCYVCNAFDLFRRRNDLPFSFHLEVASLDKRRADEILDIASEQGLTQKEVRKLAKESVLKTLPEISKDAEKIIEEKAEKKKAQKLRDAGVEPTEAPVNPQITPTEVLPPPAPQKPDGPTTEELAAVVDPEKHIEALNGCATGILFLNEHDLNKMPLIQIDRWIQVTSVITKLNKDLLEIRKNNFPAEVF